MYILAVVTDPDLDVSSSTNYQQDGIEVFIDELNDRSGSYGSDDVHYRVNYENERSTDAGEEPRWYTKTSIRYDEEGNPIGYIIEACFQFNVADPANDMKLGFDLQINACSGGSRRDDPALFDTTGNAYQNTSLFGEIVLEGKKDTDVTPAYPYGLWYYIEVVEGRNLDIYVNPEVVKGPLENAKLVAANPNATQADIDAAYAAIAEALTKLDDGSGMQNPAGLPNIAGLPDMMKFNDGRDVVTAEDWELRRQEILDLYSYYMYGYMPDKTLENLTYTVTDPKGGQAGKELNITVEKDGVSATFSVLFTLPETEAPEGGYPYFIEYSGYKMSFWGMEWWTGPSGNQTFAANRGYAGVAYDPTSVASDSDARTGAFYTLYPYGEDYKSQNGSLMGWAWGVSKIIDALEAGAAEELNINVENCLVGGVSRYGKGTAVAGAYEPRIKVVIPSCSGAGGLAIYRTNNQGKVYDLSSLGGSEAWTNTSANEPLSNLQGGEAYWFCGNFAKIPGVEAIPVDQHMLAALVADPDRHMIIVTGVTSEGWNNTEGQCLAYVASQEAWDLLGVGDQNNMIIHLDGHAILTSDMQYILDYCDVYLYGKDPSEVESDLSEMKGNLFLEHNRDNLYEEFEPYLNPLVTVKPLAESVAYGQNVAVEIETSIPVKMDIPEGAMTLYVQFIENGTNTVAGEVFVAMPAMKKGEFKTTMEVMAFADGVDPAKAENYTMYITAAGGSEGEGIVASGQVASIAITPMTEIVYVIRQDSNRVERADMIGFGVTIVGQHLMTEDITLEFAGARNGEGTEGLTFAFTKDGEATQYDYNILPEDTVVGDVFTYTCAAIGKTVTFTIYTVDMEEQAPNLDAVEYGGSAIPGVDSVTSIGKVWVTEGQYLALRSQPYVSKDNFITWLPRHTEVLIYGYSSDGAWAYVSTPDMVTRGWVCFEYVKEEGERLEVGNTWEDAPHYNGMGVVTEYVHVYTEPSIWAATLHMVSEGECVSIIQTVPGESGYTQWVLIQTESGLVGYIPIDNVRQTLTAGVTVYSFHAGAVVYVDASDLTLRAEPYGAPIGSLARNAEVTVIQDMGNGWAHVSTALGEGYVSTTYLNTEKAYEEGDVSLEVVGENQAGYFAAGEVAVVNCGEGLDYRTGPGYSFEKLSTEKTRLQSGTEVIVVTDNGYGWVLIEHPETGDNVWVSRSYLKRLYVEPAPEVPAEPAPEEPVE